MASGFIRVWANNGWMGVDLFFVLSGFLVSGLLFREQQQHGVIRPVRFYIRRGLKIYPAFYCMLLLSVVCLMFTPWSLSPWAIFSEAVFVQNYGIPVWGHTWSLAVEEHFYILLPLLLIGLMRLSRDTNNPFRALPGIFVALAISLLVVRTVTLLGDSPWRLRVSEQTYCRIDSLMFGVVISYFAHYTTGKGCGASWEGIPACWPAHRCCALSCLSSPETTPGCSKVDLL